MFSQNCMSVTSLSTNIMWCFMKSIFLICYLLCRCRLYYAKSFREFVLADHNHKGVRSANPNNLSVTITSVAEQLNMLNVSYIWEFVCLFVWFVYFIIVNFWSRWCLLNSLAIFPLREIIVKIRNSFSLTLMGKCTLIYYYTWV